MYSSQLDSSQTCSGCALGEGVSRDSRVKAELPCFPGPSGGGVCFVIRRRGSCCGVVMRSSAPLCSFRRPLWSPICSRRLATMNDPLFVARPCSHLHTTPWRCAVAITLSSRFCGHATSLSSVNTRVLVAAAAHRRFPCTNPRPSDALAFAAPTHLLSDARDNQRRNALVGCNRSVASSTGVQPLLSRLVKSIRLLSIFALRTAVLRQSLQ